MKFIREYYWNLPILSKKIKAQKRPYSFSDHSPVQFMDSIQCSRTTIAFGAVQSTRSHKKSRPNSVKIRKIGYHYLVPYSPLCINFSKSSRLSSNWTRDNGRSFFGGNLGSLADIIGKSFFSRSYRLWNWRYLMEQWNTPFTWTL